MLIDTAEVKRMCDKYIENHRANKNNPISQGVIIAMDSFKSLIELKEACNGRYKVNA